MCSHWYLWLKGNIGTALLSDIRFPVTRAHTEDESQCGVSEGSAHALSGWEQPHRRCSRVRAQHTPAWACVTTISSITKDNNDRTFLLLFLWLVSRRCCSHRSFPALSNCGLCKKLRIWNRLFICGLRVVCGHGYCCFFSLLLFCCYCSTVRDCFNCNKK